MILSWRTLLRKRTMWWDGSARARRRISRLLVCLIVGVSLFALWVIVLPEGAWAKSRQPLPPSEGQAAPEEPDLPVEDDLFLWHKWLIREEAREAHRRRHFITYTVQPGDTLWGIARRFKVDIDTLRWCNPAIQRNPDRIWDGQQIRIPPRRGACYTVRPGDTLASIAKAWGVAPVDITAEPLNGLRQPYQLTPGQELFIPNGRKDLSRWLRKPRSVPGYDFAWPLVGTLTQRYSARHRALDIGTIYGAPVYAARGGVVIYASWARTGYGYTVIIDHGGGMRTLYSHLKGAWVHKGDRVRQGQLIGEAGSTGRSTGPHLHFEIRVNGRRMNPLDYLPPEP